MSTSREELPPANNKATLRGFEADIPSLLERLLSGGTISAGCGHHKMAWNEASQRVELTASVVRVILARLAATPKAGVDREVIARIIDPEAFELLSPPKWESLARHETQAWAQLCALRRADAILALPSVLGGVDQQETQTTKPSQSKTEASATETAYPWPRAIGACRHYGNSWHADISFARYPTDEEIDALREFLSDHHVHTRSDYNLHGLVLLADELRAAQRAYMSDRGNNEKGRAVALAAEAYDSKRADNAGPVSGGGR